MQPAIDYDLRMMIIAQEKSVNYNIIYYIIDQISFSLLRQRADDEALTRLLQTSLFLVALRVANPGQVEVFLPQIFPDIVHPDLPLSPSASLSIHVSMPRLVVFLHPSVPDVQTTGISFS